MTIDERVGSICRWTNAGLREAVKAAMTQAVDDALAAERQRIREAVEVLTDAEWKLLRNFAEDTLGSIKILSLARLFRKIIRVYDSRFAAIDAAGEEGEV